MNDEQYKEFLKYDKKMEPNFKAFRRDFMPNDSPEKLKILSQDPNYRGKTVIYVNGERIGDFFKSSKEGRNDPRTLAKIKETGGVCGVFTIEKVKYVPTTFF